MGRKTSNGSKTFISILQSDGTFRMPAKEVTADTPGAVTFVEVDEDEFETTKYFEEGTQKREYKDKEGVKHTKYELVFAEIDGMITGVELYEGKYGTNLLITLEHDEGTDVLSFPTASNYGEDVLAKLPLIDFTKPVSFHPYRGNFNGKDRRGTSVKQADMEWADDKVPSFYKEWDNAKKETILKNGLEKIKAPTAPKGKKISSDKWKAYFTEVRMMMIDYVEETIVPQFEKTAEDTDKEGF